MSIIHFDTTTASAAKIELSLSGGWASDYEFYPDSATAGFRFDNDGYVYRLQGGSQSPISGDTDWIGEKPVIFNGADYEIRWHEVSAFNEGGAGTLTRIPTTGWDEATFLPLDTDKQILYQSYTNPKFQEPYYTIGPGWVITLTFEIRIGDGANTTLNPIVSTFDAENVAEVGVFYTINLNGL